MGYSIWGLKELDTTEHISMHDGRTAMWMCLMLLTCIVPCKVLLVASWPAGFSGDTQSSVVFQSVEEYSNYHTIAFISHVSKVILKILQTWFQQDMN